MGNRKSVVLLSGRPDLDTIVHWLAVQGFDVSNVPLVHAEAPGSLEIDAASPGNEYLDVRVDVRVILRMASALSGKMIFLPTKPLF